MARSILDYFERRATEEERLAASSSHPGVKATHERFAAAYRAQAGSEHPMYRAIGQQQDVHAEG